jgi:hypothetical protein
MPRSYSFKYESALNSNYSHMAAYFRKFHANFRPKNTRIFKGMNPTLPAGSELIFDSNFESGNLDCVVKVGEAEYDLYLRIDTNTRGHLQWFNFTVKNCGKRRVRFNIVNFKKAKTLYQRVTHCLLRECDLTSIATMSSKRETSDGPRAHKTCATLEGN